nr:PREDICTED: uncharacterized protein LOC109035002 [Bemisia tabaci]
MFFEKCKPRGANSKMMCFYLALLIFLLHPHEQDAQFKRPPTAARYKENSPCVGFKNKTRNCQRDCKNLANEFSTMKSTCKDKIKNTVGNLDNFFAGLCEDLNEGYCKRGKCYCRSHDDKSIKTQRLSYCRDQARRIDQEIFLRYQIDLTLP